MHQNSEWVYQSLFNYADYEFNTNTSLLINSMISVEEGNFSNLMLSMSVYNKVTNLRKSCTLNYTNLFDLLRSFKDALKTPTELYQNKLEIFKRYKSGTDLFFKFEHSQSYGQIVKIVIMSNPNDFVETIVRHDVIMTVLSCLNSTKEQFFVIQSNLINQYQSTQIINNLFEIKRSVQNLPNVLNPNDDIREIVNILNKQPSVNIGTKQEIKPSTTENINVKVLDSEVTGELNVQPSITYEKILDEEQNEPEEISDGGINSEFMSFMTENIDKVKLPELDICEKEFQNPEEAEAKKNLIYQSDFIEKCLKNDISNFETFLNDMMLSDESYIENFKKYFSDCLSLDQIFPDLNEDQIKSFTLLNSVNIKQIYGSYIDSGSKLPGTIPIINYKIDPKNITEKHRELAYELLLISMYIRIMRTYLENRVESAESNKSIIHLLTRTNTDFFIFSVIDFKNIHIDSFVSAIVLRFDTYQKKGFFKKYEELLASYKINAITDYVLKSNLQTVAEQVSKNYDGVVWDIEKRHSDSYASGLIKIPYKNNYTLEQISKEIVNLECGRRLQRNLSSMTKDQDLLNLYSGKNTAVSSVVDQSTYVSILDRFISREEHIGKIPKHIQEQLCSKVKEIKYGEFPYDMNMEEFDDESLQAIYTWNNLDSREKESYTSFRSKVENELDRDMILSLISTVNTDKPERSDDDWSGLDNFS